ncbi:hypothetical protein, partial [Limnospira sp. PMC 1242.20]|uniref:hypothetical protein n=2 Tax=unclassified Limnospira TaxID=2642885 RepID=UPI0028E0E5CB
MHELESRAIELALAPTACLPRASRKTPGRVGSSVIYRGEENRLKRMTAASTPLRGGGVWLPLHG